MDELSKESSMDDVANYLNWVNKNIIEQKTNFRLESFIIHSKLKKFNKLKKCED